MELSSAPLTGVLPWGPPTDSFELFEGLIGYRIGTIALSPLPGRITLLLRAGSHVHWRLDMAGAPTGRRHEWRNPGTGEPVHLTFDFLGETLELPAQITYEGRGYIPGTALGGSTPLERVTAQWLNLPGLRDASQLDDVREDGVRRSWSGRWEIELCGWQVTLDSRPDHDLVYPEAKRDYLSVVTHHMAARRTEGAPFTAAEVYDFLMGLQYAFSFAVGRWVAPVLAVAFDEEGRVAWSQWAPLHVDTPAKDSGRWWDEARPEDLRHFLSAFMAIWGDPAQRHTTTFTVSSAIAAGESGFVEQRLMTSLAAIEHLSWVTEVQSGRREEGSWRSKKADWRVRNLLRTANVDPQVAGSRLPSLAAFANKGSHHDGPAAIVAVRHSITHPKDARGHDEPPHLVAEAARLSSRYLDLLVLHRMGYQGHVRDRTKVAGWSEASESVPWASSML